MEDRNMEAQVWQRVRSAAEEPARNDLRQLRREAMELAAAYRSMIPQFSGRQQELARQLYLGEKANGRKLTGIGILCRCPEETLKLWQPGKESPGKVLERCYHRTRRCAAEYLARSADPEYGTVFRMMADREGEHCGIIAELMGSFG